ncbi:unnamed protein product [Triticum turgidum subsp. durum]|uniref:Uncharacterized protein n=1 Tax=Triticum turgidum subsp. durum TaxID=4567 RepID=A0A9R1RWV2_TRITD|nr:unnamed protein product [Triticum turgidum subsp. durum]
MGGGGLHAAGSARSSCSGHGGLPRRRCRQGRRGMGRSGGPRASMAASLQQRAREIEGDESKRGKENKGRGRWRGKECRAATGARSVASVIGGRRSSGTRWLCSGAADRAGERRG